MWCCEVRWCRSSSIAVSASPAATFRRRSCATSVDMMCCCVRATCSWSISMDARRRLPIGAIAWTTFAMPSAISLDGVRGDAICSLCSVAAMSEASLPATVRRSSWLTSLSMWCCEVRWCRSSSIAVSASPAATLRRRSCATSVAMICCWIRAVCSWLASIETRRLEPSRAIDSITPTRPSVKSLEGFRGDAI